MSHINNNNNNYGDNNHNNHNRGGSRQYNGGLNNLQDSLNTFGQAEASAGLSRAVSLNDGRGGLPREDTAVSNVTMRHQWRQHTVTQGIIPGPRSGAASVVVGNKLYVFEATPTSGPKNV